MERTLGQLLYALRQGNLLLPNFQRPFVWEPKRWQLLLASIMLEYPIGQGLIGTEADSKTMSAKRPLSVPEKTMSDIFMKKAKLTNESATNCKAEEYLQLGQSYSCEYLLDGQQRLTALDLIFSSTYHFAEQKELTNNYRLRWFIDLNKIGLIDLEWHNIREMQHEDICDAIVFIKYKKNDISSPLNYNKTDSDLADLCVSKSLQEKVGLYESIYLPLDKIYTENHEKNSLELDSNNFLIDLFDDRQDIIINQTNEGEKLKSTKKNIEHNQYKEEHKQLTRKFNKWKQNLIIKLTEIIRFPFPVLEVRSQEFNRLSGIFSVINMGGLKLETFDLLVAKTNTERSGIRQVMQDACYQSMKDFKKSLEILPEPARKEDFEIFWNIGKFLGEKNPDQIVDGSEFPESISRSYAQTIALHSQLSEILGNDWATRSNPISQCRENCKNPSLIRANPQEAARSILRYEEWGYSDKIILSLSKQQVQNVQEQAAKQLLRAYFLMKARLGILKLSYLPYRQMDLVLSTILTDSIWKQLIQDPAGTIMKKLQWWYWSSLFGGAYKKAYSSIDKRIISDIPRLFAYLSKPKTKWNEISDLRDGNYQYSWKGLPLDNARFTEIPITGSNGKLGSRFETICDADGYSNKETLMSSSSKTMGLSILAFTLRNGLSDFKYRDKTDNSLKRGKPNHTGRDDLQKDHLFSVNAWYKFTGEKVGRNDDHPINSPLNCSWCSSQANRYWSDNPSFMKLELQSALKGDSESIDFLHEHLLSVEAVEREYKEILLSVEEMQKENATLVFQSLLEKRFEKLRQQILAENPEI